MKGYTDTEQSKKLAEILPLESADMYYDVNSYGVRTTPEVLITSVVRKKTFHVGHLPHCSMLYHILSTYLILSFIDWELIRGMMIMLYGIMIMALQSLI